MPMDIKGFWNFLRRPTVNSNDVLIDTDNLDTVADVSYGAGPSDDEVLTYDSGGWTNKAPVVADYIDAYSTSSQTMTTGFATVVLGSTRNGQGFSLASNEVTCNTAGIYLVIGRVAFDSGSSSSVGAEADMQLDTGGGYSTITGTTGGPPGEDDRDPAHIMTAILNLSVGDKLRLRARETEGTMNLRAGSSIICWGK